MHSATHDTARCPSDRDLALSWRQPAIIEPSEVSASRVDATIDAATDEVAEMLLMYSAIEHGLRRLPPNEARTFARIEYRAFRGFDCAREASHHRIAHFMVHRLGLFDEFQARDLHSAFPRLECYRHMLARFRARLPSVGPVSALDFDTLFYLLAIE